MTIVDRQTQKLLVGFGGIVVASLLVGIVGDWWFLAGVPALALLIYLAIVDFKKVFFFLLFLLPLSTEVWLPNGVVTDLPTEPLTVLMMGIYFLYVLRQGKALSAGFLRHPITLLLLAHLGWMFFTAITSQAFVVSGKFFLAKVWYVTTFYFLAGSLLKTEKDFRTLLWCVFIPLFFIILYVLYGHSKLGFSFADVNHPVHPFFRNKVAYACMMTLFLPFVWFGRKFYRRFSWRWWWLLAGVGVFLVGIQFSYTRAAYVMLAMAIGAGIAIHFKLMKPVLLVSAVVAVFGIANLLQENAYLNMKPNYDKTITHDRFDDLLSATTEGRDVSTMERVYRWVAGMQMIEDKPLLGFGPGTFTAFYKTYTVHGFRTYVSENTEGSGIHSYYLMTFVEQGFIGGLIFVALVFFVLLKGEQIYHETTDPTRRRIVMTVLLCIVVIDGLLLMNDLLETDKAGTFFFLCMAVLVNMDLKNKREKQADGDESI
ncbi:MAG: O-antigen ligase family protein [Bacteroidota bacterium]